MANVAGEERGQVVGWGERGRKWLKTPLGTVQSR